MALAQDIPSGEVITQNSQFNDGQDPAGPSIAGWTVSSGYEAGVAELWNGRFVFRGTTIPSGTTAGRFQNHYLYDTYPGSRAGLEAGLYSITWRLTGQGGTADYCWARGHLAHDSTTAAETTYFNVWVPGDIIGGGWMTRQYTETLPLGTSVIGLSIRSTNADAGPGAYAGIDEGAVILTERVGWDVQGYTVNISQTDGNLPANPPAPGYGMIGGHTLNRGGMFINDPDVTFNWPATSLSIGTKGTILLRDGNLRVGELDLRNAGSFVWQGGSIEITGKLKGLLSADPVVADDILELTVNPGVGGTAFFSSVNESALEGAVRVNVATGSLQVEGAVDIPTMVVRDAARVALTSYYFGGYTDDDGWVFEPGSELFGSGTLRSPVTIEAGATLQPYNGTLTLTGECLLEGDLKARLDQASASFFQTPYAIISEGMMFTNASPKLPTAVAATIKSYDWTTAYWNVSHTWPLIMGNIAPNAHFTLQPSGYSNLNLLAAARPDAGFSLVGEGDDGATGLFLKYSPIAAPSIVNWVVTEETCLKHNGAINITVTGTSPTFSWSGPGGFSASTEDITGLGAGAYLVNVTNSAGVASQEIIVSAANGPDSDGDGTADCDDGCPSDPNKLDPGACGCGVADTDSDGDSTPDCNDGCPSDPLKTSPGTCGCGTPDADSDGDGTADCDDGCPNDPLKTSPGTCGCGVADTDSDGDGTADCDDGCPSDPLKTSPGTCGCGTPDADSDGDGVADCDDACPAVAGEAPNGCPAGTITVDSVSATTCGDSNGAISITLVNATGVSWTGPDGFSSSSEDLTGLAAGEYTATATGSSGAPVTQSVTVTAAPDTEAPVFYAWPENTTISASAECVGNTPFLLKQLVVSDNCTQAPILQQSPESGAVLGVGQHLVTFTATDASGNTAIATAWITVSGSPNQWFADIDGDGFGDPTSGVVACVQPDGYVADQSDLCPTDANKSSPGVCGCGVPDSDTDADGVPDCNDACPDVFGNGSNGCPLPTVVLVAASPTTCDLANGSIDITTSNATSIEWTGPNGFTSSLEDLTGLATGNYTVLVFGLSDPPAQLLVPISSITDSTPPEITRFPLSTSVAADPSCAAVVPDLSSQVTATDNCIGGVTITQTPAPGQLFAIGTHTMTFIATDAAGNNASAQSAFIVTGSETTWYLDVDHDGVGVDDPEFNIVSCGTTPPVAGFVSVAGDLCPDVAGNLPNGCLARPEDLNHDGLVDGADLTILFSQWGECAACDADLNGDGIVDGGDLTLMMVAWG